MGASKDQVLLHPLANCDEHSESSHFVSSDVACSLRSSTSSSSCADDTVTTAGYNAPAQPQNDPEVPDVTDAKPLIDFGLKIRRQSFTAFEGLPKFPWQNNNVAARRKNAHVSSRNETEDKSNASTTSNTPNTSNNIQAEKRDNIIKKIVDDFTPNGDQKILRAIGRTAAVNAAVLATAATGGSAGVVGFITGGAITAKRLGDGVINDDEKEVAKSLAVYSCATGASVAGQAVTGALMLGLVGASLPLAGAVAFGVGCCSGITAGALSEWTVDSVLDKEKGKNEGAESNSDEDNDTNDEEESQEEFELTCVERGSENCNRIGDGCHVSISECDGDSALLSDNESFSNEEYYM